MPQRLSHNARRAGAETPAAQAWYAVTADGDSALRIVPGLTLGEHPDGALALNARAPAACWMIVDVCDGAASFRALESHRLVGEDGRDVDHVPLCDGLCLALPNNLLRISRSIRPPAASGPTVAVQVAEPAPQPHRNGDARADARSASAAEPIPAATGGAARETAASAVQPAVGLSPKVAWVLGAGAVGSVLLAAWLASVPGPGPGQQSPMPRAEPAAISPGEPVADSGPAPGPVLSLVPLKRPATAKRLLPLPGQVAGAGPQAAPSAGSDAPLADATPAAAAGAGPPAAPRLAAAREHLEAGRITYPPGDNAVALALAVLRDHPGHPGAMDVLARCTTQLLAEARAHREAGRRYEARNVLEELLGFNPEHPEARRLWAEWVGTPR